MLFRSGQISPEEAMRRVNLLRRSVKYRAVDVHWHEPVESMIEAMMSRGDRRIADVVETAWRAGARFDAWSEHFNLERWQDACRVCGVSMEHIAQDAFTTDTVLPWSHLSAAVTTRWLARERRLAQEEITTPDCSYEKCSACGVCPKLNIDIQTQEQRHV